MTQPIEEISHEKKLTIKLLNLFPRQGEWIESDYFNLPDTNKVIELSEGRLIIPDMPNEEHQKISLRLSFALYSYVLKNKIGYVRYSPLPVILWKDKIREPDIVFMSNEHKDRIFEKYWGIPDLVMEILSESTAKEDRTEKFYEYAKAGILEYWIINPFKKNVAVFTFEDGVYELFGKCGIGETAKSKLIVGFEISINELME